MKRMAVMVVMCSAWLGEFGCGGSSARSPKEKCDDLVDQICDRIVECVPEAAGMHTECVQEFMTIQACTSVKSIGASFDQCMDELESRSCQMLFPTTDTFSLPTTCNRVIITQASSRDTAPTLQLATPLSGLVRGAVDRIGRIGRQNPSD